MEDEFIQNQERLKPQEEKNEVMKDMYTCFPGFLSFLKNKGQLFKAWLMLTLAKI